MALVSVPLFSCHQSSISRHLNIFTPKSSSTSQLTVRNVDSRPLFQWNEIISGYARSRSWVDVIILFHKLISETDCMPDNFTLPSVIKACGYGVFDPRLGKVIHGFGVKFGLISDVFVGNAIISMYGKYGFVEDAVKLFDCMPERNLVSWNSMIGAFSENGFFQESLDALLKMLLQDVIPDEVTLVTILPVCASEGNLELGMAIHGLAVKFGLDEDTRLKNVLIDMYSKCGVLFEAERLFNRCNKKNVVSWNIMLACYSREGNAHETFNILHKMNMEEDSPKADEVTILNALPVFSKKSNLMRLREVHGYSIRNGFHYGELVSNGFVAGYAKCGSMTSAKHVFSAKKSKTLSSWNALIGGFAQNADPIMALEIFLEMTRAGLEPDSFTIGSLLLACAHPNYINYGKELHGYVLRSGLENDSFIHISLLSLYTRSGKPIEARILFDSIADKNLVSWNAMLAGYSQNALPNESLILFRQMLAGGQKPLEIAITSVFGACAQLSALRAGKETHCFALKSHLIKDPIVGCSIIDMYAKCGNINEAQKVFDISNEKDVVASWSVLVGGYGINGNGKKAIELFEEMKKSGLNPDGFTYIAILMACSHSGLVEEGLMYFHQMTKLHKIEQKLEHYACAVDMLGRAGQLNQALQLINEMPMKPDAGIWSSLLNSCKIYGDFDLGEKIAEKLLILEPQRAENYVLVSNFFAQSRKWSDVRRIRRQMKDLGLQKDAGCSWTEIKGKGYNFISGDKKIRE